MEYTSIPWDNYRKGDVQSHNSWTVNLALWFVHVLAGNNYEVGWGYGRLADENLAAPTLAEGQGEPASAHHIETGDTNKRAEEENEDSESGDSNGSSDSDDSERTVPFEVNPTIKRKRGSDAEEGYYLSFSKRQFLGI